MELQINCRQLFGLGKDCRKTFSKEKGFTVMPIRSTTRFFFFRL